MSFEEALQGKKVTVMGLGRFGGGIAAVRFLAEQGAHVTISDHAEREQLRQSLQAVEDLPLAAVHLGNHLPEDFTEADLVVVSPAIRRDHPMLLLAAEHDVPLTSEISLFWQLQRGRVIGVTGSNGKSTTTALIHAILQESGLRCWLGGNIGRSLLPSYREIEPEDWVVLELSSFQLADLSRIQAAPEIAVVTNFSPNHLDWHSSLDEYRTCKQQILAWQTADQWAVLNSDDADVAAWTGGEGRRSWFGETPREGRGVFATPLGARSQEDGPTQDFPLQEWLTIPGEHNLQNALAAVCVARLLGLPLDVIERGIRGFRALPHRLQLVGEYDGRVFYNDSKATTPEASCRALRAIERPVVLLAGGYDKHVDLSKWAGEITQRAKGVALMGPTGDRLHELLCRQSENADSDTQLQVSPPGLKLAEAVQWAKEHSAPGEVVLLSPGCASYGEFQNYEQRGAEFVRLIEQ